MFFYSFGAAGRSGDVAVLKAGLTNVSLVELGGPLAILSKKRHRSESRLFKFMQKHNKNMGFYKASVLRTKAHHDFKVSSLFYCFFTISGEFSVFSQKLLLVAFDVRWLFSLVGSHLKPKCINLHALSPSISGKLSGLGFFSAQLHKNHQNWQLQTSGADLRPFLTDGPPANVVTLSMTFPFVQIVKVKS